MMAEKKLNIWEKLMTVQSELKAPKTNFNSYGNYKYRSCEDILEAVKPLLAKVGAVITLADDIAVIGDRYYVKTTASFINVDDGNAITNVAFAREEATKKGADPSQITGASSSYCRKYCLNGLLCIDDAQDADTQDNREKPTEQKTTAAKPKTSVAPDQYVMGQGDKTQIKTKAGWKPIVELTDEELATVRKYEQYKQAFTAIDAELEVRKQPVKF